MSPSHTRRRGRVCLGASRRGHGLYPAEQARIRRLLIERIDVAPDGISVTRMLRGFAASLRSWRSRRRLLWSRLNPIGGCGVMTERAALELDTLTIRIPIQLQRRGGRKLIMTPEGVAAPARKPSRDETLIKAVVRAPPVAAADRERSGHLDHRLAGQEAVTDAYVCRLLPLTCLAPDIVEAILDGRQPKGLRLAEMLGSRPLIWTAQRESVGLTN
jgi:hypothetical protein